MIMDEFLKLINEFDEKHNDSKWCENFYRYVLEHENELDTFFQKGLPISGERLEQIFAEISKSVSFDFKIECAVKYNIPSYDLYKNIKYENLNQYKEFFIKELSNFTIIPSDAANNTDLLLFCVENNFEHCIKNFNTSAFTLDVLNSNREFFIEWLNKNMVNRSIGLYIKMSNERLNVYDSFAFLQFCLNNNITTVLKDFFAYSRGLFTPEFLNENKELMVKTINEYFNGSTLADFNIFKFCLDNNLLSDSRILFFNEKYYTKEILNQYKDIFIRVFNRESLHISSSLYNQDILDFAFENKIYPLIDNYFYKNILFTKESFDRNKENATQYFTQISENSFFWCFKDNTDVVEFVFENGISNVINWIMTRKPSLISEELIIKCENSLRNYFKEYNIPELIRGNYKLIRRIIGNGIIDLGIDKDLAVYKLDYLYNINDEVLQTIDFKLLSYDFDLEFLSKITIYRDIQEKIMKLNEHSLNIFYRVAKLLNNDSVDLSSIIVKFLDNINNFEHILDSIDVNSLSDEQVKNYIEIIELNCDFGITNASELLNERFTEQKKNYYDNFDKNIDEHSIEEIQQAIFQKHYGIDLNSAKFILARYDYDYSELVKSELDERIINIIFGIKAIIECSSKDKLIEIYRNVELVKSDYIVHAHLESAIRKSYAEMYNKTYYKIDKNSKRCDHPLVKNATYNGQEIEIYEVDGDFAMQISALGAYSGYATPENFKTDWNRPKIASHGICTSYITNSEIAAARAYHPILGFAEYEDSALLLGGNYDLVSRDANLTFDTSSANPYKMLPPRAMIDATRHNHNEMVIERRKQGSYMGKSTPKRQPNYIVYIVDSMDNAENFSSSNSIYEETLQAASDFGVPVIVIDRSKHSRREMEKCVALEYEFKKSHDLNVLEELFLKYFNNNIGGRFFSSNPEYAKNNLFDSDSVVNLYKRIVEFVSNYIESDYEKVIILNKIIDILNREERNYVDPNDLDKKPFNYAEEIQKLSYMIDKIKDQIEMKSIPNEEIASSRSR